LVFILNSYHTTFTVNLKTAQELAKNQVKLHNTQAAAAGGGGAGPAPAVGAGFTAPSGGGGGKAAKPEKIDQSGMPGHGGPTGPIDKLHGGKLCCSFIRPKFV